MNFKYKLHKDDYKKIIYEQNNKTNIVYLIIMSFVFLIITSSLLLDNTLIVFIAYLIYIAIMIIVFFVINKILTYIIVKLNEKNLGVKYGIYECKLEKNKIVEQIENLKYEIIFDDIKKVKYTKKSITIFLKSKFIALIFKKDLFQNPKCFNELEKALKKVNNLE